MSLLKKQKESNKNKDSDIKKLKEIGRKEQNFEEIPDRKH